MTPRNAITIQSLLDGLDAAAVEMEKRWGVGRLRLLVSDDLRERFDRQVQRLNAVALDGSDDELRATVEAMRRGWLALDQAARASGAPELHPDIWEIRLADGTVAALCRTGAEAHAVVRTKRYVSIWTADEIARVIDGFPDIAKAKAIFPGATVEAVRVKTPPIDWTTGDPVGELA
jgi:hypothetical protein